MSTDTASALAVGLAAAPGPGPMAKALGGSGLLPFVGLALLVWLLPTETAAWVALALVAYGALIASFLGGIHWGVSMARGHRAAGPLVWGVTPSLLAWPGLLMPVHAALPWLGFLLVVCYLVDRRLYPAAGLEAWLALRAQLTLVASLSCFVAAGAV